MNRVALLLTISYLAAATCLSAGAAAPPERVLHAPDAPLDEVIRLVRSKLDGKILFAVFRVSEDESIDADDVLDEAEVVNIEYEKNDLARRSP